MCLFGGSTKVVHYRDRGTYIGDSSRPGSKFRAAFRLWGPNGKSPERRGWTALPLGRPKTGETKGKEEAKPSGLPKK